MQPAAEEEGLRGETARNERLSVLGSLVSGLAHEIRTPLAAATNHLSLLQKRLSGPLPPGIEDAPGHVAATLDALDRIDDLVERLRPFVRADIETRVSPLTLDEIARETLDIFLVANPGRFATLGELGSSSPVLLDRLLLEHAVLRVAEHVGEASPDGIHLSTRESPLAVELVIASRSPATSLAPSAVAIRAARRIVEGHGGALTTRAAEDGRGCLVVLSFPRQALTEIPVA